MGDPVKPGDLVERVWGDGYITSKVRVCGVDDEFIYCDAQVVEEELWPLPPGSTPWKFDRVYGVETDEEMGWGMEPYGRNVVLTRIVLPK